MVKSGANVSLRILKQGAIYHGLATLLIQSPTKGNFTIPLNVPNVLLKDDVIVYL